MLSRDQPAGRCVCGAPPQIQLVSDDELDELLLCDACAQALAAGWALRAVVPLG